MCKRSSGITLINGRLITSCWAQVSPRLKRWKCEDVHDGKLPDTCKSYLPYEWRRKQVDFLHCRHEL